MLGYPISLFAKQDRFWILLHISFFQLNIHMHFSVFLTLILYLSRNLRGIFLCCREGERFVSLPQPPGSTLLFLDHLFCLGCTIYLLFNGSWNFFGLSIFRAGSEKRILSGSECFLECLPDYPSIE